MIHRKTKMSNGRTSTTTILSLSIIVLMMMMMMIKDSGGWMAACNGSSTSAECQVMVDEEQEFMMDTEEHRRILAQKNGIRYSGLQRGKAISNDYRGEQVIKAGRTSKLYDRSCRQAPC